MRAAYGEEEAQVNTGNDRKFWRSFTFSRSAHMGDIVLLGLKRSFGVSEEGIWWTKLGIK